MSIYNIAKDFSPHPGGRYASEGKWSGEELRGELRKLWESKKGSHVIVNLDGGYGYSASFLEEAFGGLARELKDKELIYGIVFLSNGEPELVDKIRGYMKDALFETEEAIRIWDFMSRWGHKVDCKGKNFWKVNVNWIDVYDFYDELSDLVDYLMEDAELCFPALCDGSGVSFEVGDMLQKLGYDLERIMG